MANEAQRIPPGPAESYRTTEDLLGWLQRNFERYGDIYRCSIHGESVYVINSPEYVEHVLLRNWRNYLRKGQTVKRIELSLGRGLISSNGEDWVRQRRMIQPAFRREAIGALIPIFAAPTLELRHKWLTAAAHGDTVDVTRDVSVTVLKITLQAIFGEDYRDVAPSFDLIAEESRNMEFAQTCAALGKIIEGLAARRRTAGKEAKDILGLMMRSHDRDTGQPMSDPQLGREGMTLVIAGHETTASLLNWLWYLLAAHPEVERRLVAEIDSVVGSELPDLEVLGRLSYMQQVIEEALRSYPPLWLMTRKAMAPDKLGEYWVPAGTAIYISPYLLQRHPGLWLDSDAFRPERFETQSGPWTDSAQLTMCPFGVGPRNCIGEFFARVEIQIHLTLLARELHLTYEPLVAPEIVAGVNLLSRHHFLMRPQARVSDR